MPALATNEYAAAFERVFSFAALTYFYIPLGVLILTILVQISSAVVSAAGKKKAESL
jgi:hypothetical protein